MTKLTQEQIQTLETAFATLPESFKNLDHPYVNMMGVQKQLEQGSKTIFYMEQNDVGMYALEMKLEE